MFLWMPLAWCCSPPGRGCPQLVPGAQLIYESMFLGTSLITEILFKTQPFSFMHFCYETFYCGAQTFIAVVAVFLLCVFFLRVSFHWGIFWRLSELLVWLCSSSVINLIIYFPGQKDTFLKHISRRFLYPCQVAVGSIYLVPSSKTTNPCQLFGLAVLLWFGWILLLLPQSSLFNVLFQYSGVPSFVHGNKIPDKSSLGSSWCFFRVSWKLHFCRFSSKTSLYICQISLLCSVFTGFNCH